MPLGLILGFGRAFRRKRTSSLDILSSKRAPRVTTRGRTASLPVSTPEKLKPYVSQCPTEVKTKSAEPTK